MVIRIKPIFFWMLVMGLVILSACSGQVTQLVQPTPAAATAISTATFQITASPPRQTATATAVPSLTPTLPPTATITPTPAALDRFQLTGLPAGVEAQAYIPEPCTYLAARWKPGGSPPGTVVFPVMIHSIAAPGRTIEDSTTISQAYFYEFMEKAHQLGFQTIDTAQLVDFLLNNDPIPLRSMILIVDDRKRGEFFQTYFAPYMKKYGWTVVNAWISHPDTPAYLWQENEALVPGGLVDFQAHGVIHNIPIEPDSTDAFIHSEIYGPIEVMQQHFGKRPIAYIWPRGLFTAKAVQVARQAGYQAGFTDLPRGPLMFNWIPLGKEEQGIDDPLMVLPRYWDTTMVSELDKVTKAAAAAESFAAANKTAEQSYLSTYCK